MFKLSKQDILFAGATVGMAVVGNYVSGKIIKKHSKARSIASFAAATLSMIELKKRKMLPKALRSEKKD